jgi:mercuric ion transport protein
MGRRVLQSLGFVGSLIAAACCLGIPFVVGAVTAVGAGFLIRVRYLLPLLAFFLLVSITGSVLSRRRHGGNTPLLLSIAGAVLTFGGLMLKPALAYFGIGLLLLGSVLDLGAAYRMERR